MMIDNLDERVTRSKSTHHAYFIDSAFITSFEPYDIRHVLYNLSWINAMREELEILRETKFRSL